jgi:hypothetical protein
MDKIAESKFSKIKKMVEENDGRWLYTIDSHGDVKTVTDLEIGVNALRFKHLNDTRIHGYHYKKIKIENPRRIKLNDTDYLEWGV